MLYYLGDLRGPEDRELPILVMQDGAFDFRVLVASLYGLDTFRLFVCRDSGTAFRAVGWNLTFNL